MLLKSWLARLLKWNTIRSTRVRRRRDQNGQSNASAAVVRTLERLEDRIVLSADLSQADFNTILAEARTGLSNVKDELNNVAQASTTVLPVVGKSVQNIFGDPNSQGTDVNGYLNSVDLFLHQVQAGLADPTYATTAIQKIVFQYLGGNYPQGIAGDRVGVLGDQDGNHFMDYHDVVVTNLDSATGSVSIDVKLSASLDESSGLNLQLGIPGFPFQVTANGVMSFDVGFSWHLVFGLDHGTPFFGTNSPNNIDVSLNAKYQSGSFEALFGFLQVEQQPGSTPSLDLTGDLTFDVTNFDILQNPILNFTANVNLPLETVPVTVISDLQMPEIRGDLTLVWSANINPNSDLANFGGLPVVQLVNPSINIGGVLKYLAGPLIKYLRVAMLPSQIFVGAVNAPIPGLSDLWHLAFPSQNDVSILKLADIANSLGIVPPPWSQVIDAANVLSSTVDSVSTLTDSTAFSTDLFNAYLSLPTINFTALANGLTQDWRTSQPSWGAGSLSDFASNPANSSTDLTSVASPYVQEIGTNLVGALQNDVPDSLKNNSSYVGAVSDLQQHLDHLGSSFSLAFPLIESPENSLFKLLLGQDFQFVKMIVDLRSVDLSRPGSGDIGLTLDKFSLPATVTFSGDKNDMKNDMKMDFYLNMGFDTRGLRTAIKKGPLGMFDGFNFDYHDPAYDPNNPLHSNPFRPLMTFNGEIDAGFLASTADAWGPVAKFLGIDLAGADAYMQGYVRANNVTVSFDDPTDHDGYFRPFSESNGLDRLFATSGTVDAGLKAGVDIYFGPKFARKTFNVLGPIDLGGQIIDLNHGAEANPSNPYPALLQAVKAAAPPVPDISISDASVKEGNGTGTPNKAHFRVTLDLPSDQPVTVDYATAVGGTASASDFVSQQGTLTFAPGETTKYIDVPVVGNTTMERDKTFVVNLLRPTNSRITDNFGLGTIVNDDLQPVFPSATGVLDPTYGNAGTASYAQTVTINGNPYASDGASGVATDSNGRIVLFGDSVPGTDNSFKEVRLNPNGTLDQTFGTGGVQRNIPSDTYNGFGYSGGSGFAGAIYQTGSNRDKIIAVGRGAVGIGVYRLNVDGSLDTTFGKNGYFGEGDPVVQQNYLVFNDWATSAAIYESGPNAGKILVAGTNNPGTSGAAFVLLRLNFDGSLDQSFGTGGRVSFFAPNGPATSYRVKIVPGTNGQPDLIDMAGSGSPTSRDVHTGMLVRLTDKGSFDTTFGAVDPNDPTGVAKTGEFFFGANGVNGLTDFDVQADGSIVFSGTGAIKDSAGVWHYFVAGRVTSSGTLDTTFNGGAGSVSTTTEFDDDRFPISAMGLEKDGKIVVSAWRSDHYSVVRVNSDGTLDTGFAPGATDRSMLYVTAIQAAKPRAMTIDQNGNILVAGSAYQDGVNYGSNLMTSAKIVAARTNLNVSITSDITQATLNDQITYTLDLINTGQDALLPSVQFTLPHGLFQSLSLPVGWVFSTPAFNQPGAVTLTRTFLTATDPHQKFVIVEQIDPHWTVEGSIVATANVASAIPDGVPSNCSATTSITYLPPAPMVTAPATASVNENSSITFSVGNGDAIGLADVEAVGNSDTVSLTATHGTLAFDSTTGLKFTDGFNGSSSMTVWGTLANLNAALGGLTFKPTAGYAGSALLAMTGKNWRDNLSGSANIAVTVNVPAPSWTAPATGSVNENAALTFSTVNGNAISLLDVVAVLNSDTVSLTATHGTLALGSTTGLTFTSHTNGSASMTVWGTLANLNAALSGLTFTPTAGYSGSASLAFAVKNWRDNLTGSGNVAITVNVPPPTLIAPATASVNENATLTFSPGNGNAIGLLDVAAVGNSDTLSLTVTHGSLALGSTTGLTFTSGANGSASMTVWGTLANLNAALSGMTFTPTKGYSGSASLTAMAKNWRDKLTGSASVAITLN